MRSAVGAASGRDDLARPVDKSAADTIFPLDRLADDEILTWFERTWPWREHPVAIVSEAFDEPVTVGGRDPRWTCIIDPVDGTRGLMYDKRAAWSLAAVAPFGGSLVDVVASCMTELPTTKQWASDQLSATRSGTAVVAERLDVRTGHLAVLSVSPSRARTLHDGWASFARFFPPGKPLLAAFEATLWHELYGADALAALSIFDDQYVATGGQFHELAVGHDRMLGDLRPLVFERLGLDGAMACHPYDCAGLLVAQRAGCVITDPWGAPLDAPLDTTSPVAWVGFASPALAAHVRPALDAALAAHFGPPGMR